MYAFDFLRAVAAHIDAEVDGVRAGRMLRGRCRSYKKIVSAGDVHVALVRTLYEQLPTDRAYALIPREPIVSTAALAAHLIVATIRCEDRDDAELARWRAGEMFPRRVADVFRTFLDSIRGGFEGQRRALENKVREGEGVAEELTRQLVKSTNEARRFQSELMRAREEVRRLKEEKTTLSWGSAKPLPN